MKKFLLLLTLVAIACTSASAAGLKLKKDPNGYETVNGISMRNLWLLDRFHYGVNELQTDFGWCNNRARTAVMQDGIVYVARSEAKQIIPQPGDTILSADGSEKKVSDILSDWHVAPEKRCLLPVIQLLDEKAQRIKAILAGFLGYKDWIVKL